MIATSTDATPRGAVSAEALAEAICLGLSAGFYVWILGGPKPADHSILKLSQTNLLSGLPLLLSFALAAGIVAALALGISETTRAWRARLALGTCALYLATLRVAIGGAAIVLAPALALVWIGVMTVRRETPMSDAALVTLHTSMLGAALAFFHQWAWYRAGWDPLLEGIGVLKTLVVGG